LFKFPAIKRKVPKEIFGPSDKERMSLKKGSGHLLYAVVLVLSVSISKAQSIEGQPAFVNYSVEDGLPSAEVYDVLQDRNGYIWVATDKGVCQFDGTRFKVFTTREGLTDNSILRLYEDSKGRLWFMGYNRTISYLQGDSIYPLKSNDQILEATERFLVFLGNTFIVNNDSIIVISISCDAIVITPSGRVDVYTRNEHHKIFESHRHWSKKDRVLISSIFPEVSEAELNGICGYQYCKSRGKIRSFTKDSQRAFISPFGLAVGSGYDPDQYKILLKNYFITGFCFDRDGGYWVTTLSNGIYYLPNPNVLKYEFKSTGDKNRNFSFVYQDSMIIGFITAQEAYRYVPDSSSFKSYEKEIQYFDIPEYYRKEEGLKFEFKLDLDIMPQEERNILAPREMMGIYNSLEINDSTIIVFFSSSKMLRGKIDGAYIHDFCVSEIYPKTYKILKTHDDQIWLGSIRGLYRFNDYDNTINPVRNSPLFEMRIQDMVETNYHRMVMATQGSGLLIWDRAKDSVIQITEREGLLSHSINRLLYQPDSNRIWIATSEGINWVSLSENGAYSIGNALDKSDGLTSLDIRQIYFYRGELFASTGMIIIKIPQFNFIREKQPPSFILKDVVAGGKSRKVNGTLKLAYYENDVAISFQGISLRSRGNIKYRYRMEGVSDSWLETQETTVNYGSLPKGKYSFTVKAIDINGVESEPQSISIEITPPLWETWWFRTLLVLLGAIILYLVVRSIINRYKYQAQMEVRLNELRSLSLRARMNPHFIFNSLNSVQNYILKNQREEANHFLVVFSRLIRLVLQNSDSLEVPLKKELEMIRLYIDLEKKRLRKDFTFEENIDPQIDMDNCMIPSLLIQPFIENAIWHGNIHLHDEGRISLSLQLEKENLKVEVQDNGIGRRAAEKKKVKNHSSYATSITQKRIKLLMEGNEDTLISFSDAYPGQEYVGTKVVFMIPYKTVMQPKDGV
tara:strand:- start:22802 stop:25696 length:2895 start_codon:yes stop_codon:yes gene_type:complete